MVSSRGCKAKGMVYLNLLRLIVLDVQAVGRELDRNWNAEWAKPHSLLEHFTLMKLKVDCHFLNKFDYLLLGN